jgi:hypothetical protein
MPQFRPKIDLYSSFTINLGPLYVERVFDSLLTKQGVKGVNSMCAAERLENYLEFLKKSINSNNHIQYSVIQFYKAHFYQQLANLSMKLENAHHFLEKALCYYQTYLELLARSDESKYYAQWQIGILQDILKYPWLLAEDSLLKANAADPLRGEATKRIIEYYMRNQNWDRAYHYSSIAMYKFYNKNPVAQRRWFIDFDAYNWNIIKAHRIISCKLGLLKEKSIANESSNGQTIAE